VGESEPPKFWFVEIPGKIFENLGKGPENLNTIPKNLGKIPENLSKNGAQRCLTSNNWRPSFAEKHMKTFFRGHIKKRSS